MSFGLNKFLKKILPTGLFYRSLIIVAAPTIILQIIITVVFIGGLTGHERTALGGPIFFQE